MATEFSHKIPQTIRRYAPFIVFLFSLVFLNILELVAKTNSPDGVHFRYMSRTRPDRPPEIRSSDCMMQALPIAQLKKTPFQSLWYLHKQPPMLDFIRAFIAAFFDGQNPQILLLRVDEVLYFVWSVFFAGLAALMFIWIIHISSDLCAWIAILIWIFHPSSIYFASDLDGTFISAFGLTWFFYELWRLSTGSISYIRLSLSLVFIFYTRTIFQWYFLPVLLFAIYLTNRASYKYLLITAIITTLCVFPLVIKQYVLFGTTDTTTFSGYHKCGIIWHMPSNEDAGRIRPLIKFKYPPDADKYSGGDQYNSEVQYEDNLILTKLFYEIIKTNPKKCLMEILHSLKLNWEEYWEASSYYAFNDVTRNLRWNGIYEYIFSSHRYMSLIFAAFIIWMFRAVKEKKSASRIRAALVLIIPFLYVFVISNLSNRYNWTEASRLKFMCEPVYLVFISSQLYYLLKIMSTQKNRQRHTL